MFFWITGGGTIAHRAAEITHLRGLDWLSSQLHHPEWHGFAFYDLIFPLFLFIAGVAMPFSFQKRIDRSKSKWDLGRHAVQRGVLLVVFVMVYNGLLDFDWANMRYPSVLGRIGLAAMFAAMIVLNTELRGRILWMFGLLVGYWAAMRFIPVPGFGAGDLSPGHTLADYLDQSLLPGRLYNGDRDPEGLLATIPAIATALAGVVTGQFLQNVRFHGYFMTAAMFFMGLVCLGAAWLWNLDFPINKNLWSSSFVLPCAGWSLLLLSVFYLVIDVWRFQSWAIFFLAIGSNSILIYMAVRFVDFGYTAQQLFGGIISPAGEWIPLLESISVLFFEWILLFALYRKKLFLKL